MKKLKVTGLLLGMFLGVTGSASASTLDYAVTFSGSGFSGRGDIAVTSGVVTGVTINGLSAFRLFPRLVPAPTSTPQKPVFSGPTTTCFLRAERRSTMPACCSASITPSPTFTPSAPSFMSH